MAVGFSMPAVLQFFASLTAILGKIGISGVESNLGMAIRTTVVLAMAWLMVLVTGKGQEVKKTRRRSWHISVCQDWQPERPGYAITGH